MILTRLSPCLFSVHLSCVKMSKHASVHIHWHWPIFSTRHTWTETYKSTLCRKFPLCDSSDAYLFVCDSRQVHLASFSQCERIMKIDSCLTQLQVLQMRHNCSCVSFYKMTLGGSSLQCSMFPVIQVVSKKLIFMLYKLYQKIIFMLYSVYHKIIFFK